MSKDKTLKAVFNHFMQTPKGRQRIIDAYWKTIRDKVDSLRASNE